MCHSAGASGHHRRFDLGFDARGELRVLSLVVGCAVESVGNAVLFRRVQREADFLFGIATALMGRSRTVSLKRHDSHAALVAGGIAAVRVERARSISLVEAAVRIVRLHGV